MANQDAELAAIRQRIDAIGLKAMLWSRYEGRGNRDGR
jgi:hypothetical protein